MFSAPPHSAPAPQPAGPPGVAAHSPLSATFHALAARSLAGKGGRPASPGMPHAGAPIAPGQPYAHMGAGC